MNNLSNFISHFVILASLLCTWFLPICSVTIRDKYENEKKQMRASVVLMMLLKIFWPNSQVKWGKLKKRG